MKISSIYKMSLSEVMAEIKKRTEQNSNNARDVVFLEILKEEAAERKGEPKNAGTQRYIDTDCDSVNVDINGQLQLFN